MPSRAFRFRELGRLGYEAGLAEQRRMHGEVVTGAAPALLSLEHDPVYTLGKRDLPNQFLDVGPGAIPVVRTERGGEVTYHGPGQAVVYVIIKLAPLKVNLPELVHCMEQAVIDTACGFGITAERRAGWRGVFVEGCKLASIGLAVQHDVTLHGLAVNVENDLAPFTRIHPCGLPVEMCSLATLGVKTPGRAAIGWLVADALASSLGGVLDVKFGP